MMSFPTRQLPVLGICFVAAGVCASGCQRQTPPPPITMRIGVGTPPTSEATAESGIRQLVNLTKGDALLANTPDQRQIARIATSWNWDQARTTLRLKLRHDVYLHDGSKLTP